MVSIAWCRPSTASSDTVVADRTSPSMNLILSEDSARAHARDDTLQEHYSAEHHFPGDLLIMVLMIWSLANFKRLNNSTFAVACEGQEH